ncbi:xylulokinase [Paramicrobacterium humi]|uniref:Xylulose kinase n=1 Tax=Paramicrobacterium humi TaxID=640635 RepID=A0A1H4KU35_9MICO|nr:xylulokinase [Microbacterium humi]SEB62021.1 xylulokinase [Microbacterium humi]
MRMLVAGVDSSTQSCKVEFRDIESGELVASGAAPHPPAFPPRSEQDPQAWWEAFVSVFRQARADLPADAEVRAISIAGQCHGLVALDEHGAVIRDAKLWNDTESAPELAELRVTVGDADFIRAVGSLPTAAFTIGKLAWLARHEPANFARLRYVLLPHDYLTFRLTGRRVTDRSEASGTGYFDAASGEYRLDLLAHVDGTREWLSLLPEVLEPSAAAGTVLPSIAAELGVDDTVLVGAGGGDQHASALGLGVEPGDVVYAFGTSGVVYTDSREPVYDPLGFVNGVADMNGGFLPLVCTMNAAKVTDTFARILGVDHAELDRLALQAGEDGPVLAAFLDGERTPDRPGARGLLSGITTSTTREQIARAAYEGVVLGLVEGHAHIERAGVVTNGDVIAVGGGSRSRAYTQLLADALGRDVFTADAGEATARGAALQAASVATGCDIDDVRRAWRPERFLAAQPRGDSRGRRDAYARTVAVTSLDEL